MQPELHIYTSVDAIEKHLPDDRAFIFVNRYPDRSVRNRSPLNVDVYRVGGLGTVISGPGVDLDAIILNINTNLDKHWAQGMFDRNKIAIGGRDFLRNWEQSTRGSSISNRVC